MIESSNPLHLPVCPIVGECSEERITLAYGEGGRLSRQLVRERIVSRFDNEILRSLGDASIMEVHSKQIAFSTDAYTVSPLFFPGGDIGRLAVLGTVNDLVVSGAIPRWLSLSLIIEEGLKWRVLEQILDSIQLAARQADVLIVTGDTKVVPRGAADGVFITTAGIGELVPPVPAGPSTLEPGDVIFVSGPIGSHGAAILCARQQLDFSPAPGSDCALLKEPIMELRSKGVVPRAIRDATRGGVAAVLHEWSEVSRLSCVIEESRIPVNPPVRAVSELLGLDPLHLANEGTFVMALPREQVDSALDVLKTFDVSRFATVIGEMVPKRITPVSVRRGLGRDVALDDPSGAPFPRIC